ncbi:MAG: hypothetical protein H8K06_10750 [Nitrospira sp.]|uniref:Uncharacterized protein n=1 Tax=Nitrospira defluvii TaxID=330214 RepID=A0ABM8QJ80_9BACT|nr:hypothetical protein [Nitrospira defluvii]MCS6327553.1 hypothetical protein [Nitrospira sp.]CAE6699619.1 conserved hypothetical protein [Nitrospira defluvii]
MMRGLQTPFSGCAAALAGLYLILALFSVACVVDHADPKPAAHHHGGTVSHSGFCAWACQANPTSDAGPVALLLQPVFVAALFVERDHSVTAGGGGFHAASRAPPVQS